MTDTDEFAQPYQRIAQDIREQVRSGQLTPGAKLPTTRALAEQYDVAPGTVQRALAELRTWQVIYSHQGRGSFVRGNPEQESQTSLDVAEELRLLREQVAALSERLSSLENKAS
ncbi:GntR family transcriptional regulator [Kitasatospora sp. NPDC051853]|uniref:GntR family transcriptional regulator n=1 Tax=Kitasatospora sp. NPDC051853 TaxID=3364058 RepID=UPI0037A9F37B